MTMIAFATNICFKDDITNCSQDAGRLSDGGALRIIAFFFYMFAGFSALQYQKEVVQEAERASAVAEIGEEVVPLVDQDENAENVIIKHLPDVSIITTEEGVNENGQMVVKVVQNIPPTSPSSVKIRRRGEAKRITTATKKIIRPLHQSLLWMTTKRLPHLILMNTPNIPLMNQTVRDRCAINGL
jgi:hypothetical protein